MKPFPPGEGQMDREERRNTRLYGALPLSRMGDLKNRQYPPCYNALILHMAERIDVAQSKGRLVQASYHIPSTREIKIHQHLASLFGVVPGDTLSFQVSEPGRVTLTGRKDLLQLAQEQNQRVLTSTLKDERTLPIDQQLLDTLRIQEGDRIVFSVSEQNEVTVTGVTKGLPPELARKIAASKKAFEALFPSKQETLFSNTHTSEQQPPTPLHKEELTQATLFDMPGIPLPSGRTRKRRTQ